MEYMITLGIRSNEPISEITDRVAYAVGTLDSTISLDVFEVQIQQSPDDLLLTK